MKIKYLGHSTFLITSYKGTKILTDPYEYEPEQPFAAVTEAVDVVTISHGHYDHGHVYTLRGNPRVFQFYKGPESVEINGVKLSSIAAYHDEHHGAYYGNITINCIEADGIRVCHLGDLGHKLSDQQIAQIGKVDILLIAMLGASMMNIELTYLVISQLKPKVIFPMHYISGSLPQHKDMPATPNTKPLLPLFKLDEFLKGRQNVVRLDTSEMEFKVDTLPSSPQIMVPKPELRLE
jgi:L-ascorbate metabolism protein UlaG (beta-lactamase superfamily)